MTTNGICNTHNHCGTTCKVIKCWKWDMSKIIHQSRCSKYAILILNRPLTQRVEFIKDFWNNAAVRVTVDGGTQQWDTFLNKLSKNIQKSMKLPDLVTGDFDSISDDILHKYKMKGCKIIHTPDQNYTDFTKGVMELNEYCQQNEIEMEQVIAIGQTSGRIDQILGNVQTMFLANEKHLLSSNTRLCLMSDNSLSWLLFPGDHMIHVPVDARGYKRSWCSLVPVGETCENITTHGLKWDLDNQRLKFGDVVSTSNTFSGPEVVTVKCSNTVLWSMKIPSLTSEDND